MTTQIHAMKSAGAEDSDSLQESPTPEQTRSRTGMVFLVLGLLLVFWACGSWVYRISADQTAAAAVRHDGVEAGTEKLKAAGGMRLLMVVVLVLALVILFGTYAAVRAARRYRAEASRQRASPTAADDVWSMHKLPGSVDDD